MFRDNKENLFVYKLPDLLTDKQVDWYFKEHLKLEGNWEYVNDVKIHRRLSTAKYTTLFASKEFNEDVETIRKYFNAHKSRDAVWIQMKSYACKYLYSKGLIMGDISKILSYKHHTSVIYFINSYKDFTNQLKIDDFMKIVRDNKYPKMINNKIEYTKL